MGFSLASRWTIASLFIVAEDANFAFPLLTPWRKMVFPFNVVVDDSFPF